MHVIVRALLLPWIVTFAASVMLFFRLFFRRGAEGERQQERADDDVHG